MIISHCWYRDHFMYAPSQWETLQCNVSHWLGACTKWSLLIAALFISRIQIQWLPSWILDKSVANQLNNFDAIHWRQFFMQSAHQSNSGLDWTGSSQDQGSFCACHEPLWNDVTLQRLSLTCMACNIENDDWEDNFSQNWWRLLHQPEPWCRAWKPYVLCDDQMRKLGAINMTSKLFYKIGG